MGKKLKDDNREAYIDAVKVCVMVKEMAEGTMNCGICGEDPPCEPACLYPLALRVLERLNVKERVG